MPRHATQFHNQRIQRNARLCEAIRTACRCASKTNARTSRARRNKKKQHGARMQNARAKFATLKRATRLNASLRGGSMMRSDATCIALALRI
eukprot:3002444-Lingulodinium_polyedra.AAC.1